MANDAEGGGFEALAQQYWNAWGEAVRHGMGSSVAPTAQVTDENWSQALDWWRRMLPNDTGTDTQVIFDRLQQQAGEWFGIMQQVATQFAGRSSTSEEIADAWRQAVQGQGERLLHWALGAFRGAGPAGFDPWLQEAVHGLEKWRRESAPWLDMPTFGLGRNQQSRWQTLAKAQQEYQSHGQAYAEQLKSALERAFELFEGKLAEHEQVGTQLKSVRALFDLWIEAAEEGYAAVALSEEFRQVYGAFANAHLRLRAALQREVEQICEHLGMPTRSEMDSAHRRIAELERMLRRMVDAQTSEAVTPARKSAAVTPEVAPSKRVSARKPKTSKVTP